VGDETPKEVKFLEAVNMRVILGEFFPGIIFILEGLASTSRYFLKEVSCAYFNLIPTGVDTCSSGAAAAEINDNEFSIAIKLWVQ
jgi:hypothetical protein